MSDYPCQDCGWPNGHHDRFCPLNISLMEQRIAELEARLQPHKAGRTNTAEMARAMYQKQSEYVGPQHEEECVRMLTLAFDSFEDRIAELEAELKKYEEPPTDLLDALSYVLDGNEDGPIVFGKAWK